MLRPTILAMKQMMIRKQIGRFDWVESYDCLADVLTKKGAPGTDRLLKIIKSGENEWWLKHLKRRFEGIWQYEHATFQHIYYRIRNPIFNLKFS